MVLGQNTQEYRKQIGHAAISIAPDLLKNAGGTLSVREIHSRFRQKRADLCDDSVKCQCGQDHPVWGHQVDWGLQRLKERRVVENAGRGFWHLRDVATGMPSPPESVPPPVLVPPHPAPAVAAPSPAPSPSQAGTAGGDRIISVRDQIVAKLNGMGDRQFEEFVGQLLAEFGYENVRVVGRSGDGGVDVTCELKAPLVEPPLAVVCQVKRHAGKVGPSVVGDLRGRWAHRADRLILINAGGFTPGAYEAAKEPAAKEISLVSGEDVADLMIQKEIGVIKRPVVEEKVDDDFWAGF